MTAVGVGPDGGPVGVVMVCQGQITTAHLRPYDAQDGREPFGSWQRSRPLRGYDSWPLATGDADWTVTRPMAPLGETRLDFRAWSGNDWTSTSIGFSTADLAALKPGEVRYTEIDRNGREIPRTVTVEEFRAKACDTPSD
ncbi:hypothetical protein [Kitasatospora sp. KL5]|uniref:hypothetical protein n=1 Tax=Kitasatospora sp. KL5 TaxID=3425125 RepID=UPI003D6F25A9